MLMLKDLKLAMEAADDVDASVPTGAAAESLYQAFANLSSGGKVARASSSCSIGTGRFAVWVSARSNERDRRKAVDKLFQQRGLSY